MALFQSQKKEIEAQKKAVERKREVVKLSRLLAEFIRREGSYRIQEEGAYHVIYCDFYSPQEDPRTMGLAYEHSSIEEKFLLRDFDYAVIQAEWLRKKRDQRIADYREYLLTLMDNSLYIYENDL